jgi:hypothetical protein
MSDNVDNLVLDLLEWLSSGPRRYLDVMEAWRTSCPSLPVWEVANERGFIERRHAPGCGQLVSVSAIGTDHLRARRSRAGWIAPSGTSPWEKLVDEGRPQPLLVPLPAPAPVEDEQAVHLGRRDGVDDVGGVALSKPGPQGAGTGE